MGKFFRIIFKLLGILVLLVIVYIGAEFGLSRLSVNDKNTAKNEVTIYLTTNGVHNELILPFDNDVKDWNVEMHIDNPKQYNYASFGWGQKQFLLETPNWQSVKVTNVLSAAFGMNQQALMKVTLYNELPEQKTVPISLSYVQYEQLVKHIKSFFVVDRMGKIMPVEDVLKIYSSNTHFYDANGSYHLFNTCNTWVNTSLKKVKLKACAWTTLSTGLFTIYE